MKNVYGNTLDHVFVTTWDTMACDEVVPPDHDHYWELLHIELSAGANGDEYVLSLWRRPRGK